MRFRFHKGNRVEVFSQGEVPSGSWRYGVIESGNGHTYYIHYECPADTLGAPVQRVPRKSIRPCPPVVVIESWEAGNFVEVFDSSSWKYGEVLRATDVDLFSVRLLGTSQKVQARKSCLRLPQAWQDEKWVKIQKVNGEIENRNPDHQATKRAYHKLEKDSKMRLTRNDNYPTECEAGFEMSDMVSPRNLKRGSPCNLTRGAGRKFRAVEKDGKPQRPIPEIGMHASIKNRDTGFSEIEMKRRIRNGDTRFVSNDAERSACSVGSSDTSSKEETVDETNKLALDAYYHTMESLRALGYLTWEQEEMITDLRLKLNISNDQHLMELRKLVSAQ